MALATMIRVPDDIIKLNQNGMFFIPVENGRKNALVSHQK